ncbi:MAG: hypothetical protein LBT00_05180 [Spirochaetaceae bacterium]|nr:hypothetical protein [Spirochaetaceae bacterium]
MEEFLVWIASPFGLAMTVPPRYSSSLRVSPSLRQAGLSSLRASPLSLRAERSNPVDDNLVWIASPFGFAMTGPPRYSSSLRVSPSLNEQIPRHCERVPH